MTYGVKRSVPIILLLTLAVVGIVMMAGSKEDTAPSAPPISEGTPQILDFTAPQLDGGEVNGADYSGKDVALWFWAPW